MDNGHTEGVGVRRGAELPSTRGVLADLMGEEPSSSPGIFGCDPNRLRSGWLSY